MPSKSIDIIIPTYKPDNKFGDLIIKLREQTYPVNKIMIVNTGEEYFPSDIYEHQQGMEIIHIRPEEFDHGGTRAFAANHSQADIIMFMTQDAVPKDKYLIECLIKPLNEEDIAVAYARQLPASDCNVIERYTRQFNYGDKPVIKSAEDIPELGIKTYFCSNVCAAYRKDIYDELGGFVRKTIFNEDMIYASKVIQSGKKIAYVPKAQVIHSHNYGNMQQFKRNFDLGVSQARYLEVFENVKSESEGIRMIKKTASYLFAVHKPWLVIDLVIKSAFKLIGYKMGRHYKKLSRRVILACTMNKGYWN